MNANFAGVAADLKLQTRSYAPYAGAVRDKISELLAGIEGEITTEFFLNLGFGKVRIIAAKTGQADTASIVEKLGSGEEGIPV